ncbi:MAG: (d)CMP kinase [Armatimonadota bacterium]
MSEQRKLVVAIDGPAGSGKSSVARGLARRLGYSYIDTGAMYRAVAWAALREGLDLPEDARKIGELAGELDFDFRQTEDGQHIFVNGRDREWEIRKPEVGALSSPVSAVPLVRENLLQTQRDLAAEGGVIMEGRDIGTVVLPDADVKIFLTASARERARRRYEQIKGEHPDLTYELVLAQQKERDQRDMNRDIAPLKKADDAIEVVTDDMTLDEVIDHIAELVQERARTDA